MPKLDPIQISVVNASTVLTDSEIEPVIRALQKQVTNDFRPAWGVDAELSFVARGQQPPADTWWLTILDDADQGGRWDITISRLRVCLWVKSLPERT